MAYVPNLQIPTEEENKFANPNQTTPQPLPPPDSGSAGASATGGRAAPGVGTPTQFGSNAAKLSDYLKANQGQVDQFGQQVAGDLSQRFNDVTGQINNATSDFSNQVSQGVPNLAPEKASQAASDPFSFSKNPTDVSAFQQAYQGNYKGPDNFESTAPYAGINDQVNKAVENSSLVNSQGGLGTYLNNYLGASDSTPGMRTLDSALLMGNPNATTAIRSAAAPYQNLTSYLGDKTKQSDAAVQQAKQSAQGIGQALKQQFQGVNGVVPTFQNGLNQRVSDARTQAAGRSQNALQALLSTQSDTSAQNVSDQALADLGLTRQQLGEIANKRSSLGQGFMGPGVQIPSVNFDASPYATIQNPDVNIRPDNVASSDDYNRLAALSQLTGDDYSGILNPNLANQAGTANLDLTDVNIQQLLSDLNDKYGQFMKLYPNISDPTSGGGTGGGVIGVPENTNGGIAHI